MRERERERERERVGLSISVSLCLYLCGYVSECCKSTPEFARVYKCTYMWVFAHE